MRINPILLYLSLVVFPVAGVFGIVRLGKRLRAPVSVGGVWRVDLSPRAPLTPACDGLDVSSHPLILTVSQSGPHLILTFGEDKRVELVGAIDGEVVSGKSSAPTTAMNREGRSPIHMQAVVERQSESDRLHGVLTFPNCAAHSELSFTATRERQADHEAQER